MDYILLVKEVDSDFFFLPGGHIEHGEGARVGLQRELAEELNLDSEVKDFKGALESSWYQDGVLNCEINLIFEVTIHNIDWSIKPNSQEDHIEFQWVKVSNLDEVNLLPDPVVGIINSSNSNYWASTYEIT